MLTPEYLWSAADVVVNTYDEMNNWAIRDMAERIMAAELYGDKLPGTARYRAWMMNQSGMHYEEMSKKLAEITKKAEPDIMKLFIEAGLTSVANDYAPFGMEPYDITKDKVATQILESVYKKTKGELHNYTRTTLDQSNKLFVDVLDKAFYEVSTGMRSYNEVIQEAIETVSKEGCTVKYPSGHVDKQEVAVRRGLMTGVNQAAAELCLHNCEVLGTDYVIVDAHEGARYSETDKIANHLGWQGGVYKIHGVGTYSNEKKDIISKIIKFLHKIGIHVKNDTIPNLEEETGYPSNPLGLCGYNCRHCISPFLPQYEKAEYKNIKVDQEKSKREYDLKQKQRAKERSIRDTRRELIGLDAAIENCKDEETKFNLQMNYDKTAKKLERQTDAYNQFCDENNLTRDYNRMQTARFDRDQAYKATRGAKRYTNSSKLPTSKGNVSNKKRTYTQLQNATQKLYEDIPKYSERKSVWSGKVIVDNEKCDSINANGAKEWNCDILLRDTVDDGHILHELLHSSSISLYTADDYIKYCKMEEGAVELYTQEICKLKQITHENAYDEYVSILRNVNKKMQFASSDYEFARMLYNLEPSKRFAWFRDNALKWMNTNQVGISDVNDVLQYIDRLEDIL